MRLGVSNVNKYHAKPTVIDGIRFDSKAEARRYSELRLLELGKRIRDLKRQVLFLLHGKGGSVICRYKADFTYWEGDKYVVEDVKGMQTRDFRIKAKLFVDNFPEYDFRLVSA